MHAFKDSMWRRILKILAFWGAKQGKCNRWKRWTLYYLQSLLFRQQAGRQCEQPKRSATCKAASCYWLFRSWEHFLLVFGRTNNNNPPYVWVWLSDPGRIERQILLAHCVYRSDQVYSCMRPCLFVQGKFSSFGHLAILVVGYSYS